MSHVKRRFKRRRPRALAAHVATHIPPPPRPRLPTRRLFCLRSHAFNHQLAFAHRRPLHLRPTRLRKAQVITDGAPAANRLAVGARGRRGRRSGRRGPRQQAAAHGRRDDGQGQAQRVAAAGAAARGAVARPSRRVDLRRREIVRVPDARAAAVRNPLSAHRRRRRLWRPDLRALFRDALVVAAAHMATPRASRRLLFRIGGALDTDVKARPARKGGARRRRRVEEFPGAHRSE